MIRWLAVFIWFMPIATSAQTLAELDARIAAMVEDSTVPGMALVIVDDGEIVLEKGYGLARVSPERPMAVSTVLSPGSLSKNLTSLAVLRLVDQGKLDLNAPLSDVAPQVVIDNPYETVITLAMLLEHTSGIEGSAYSEYAFSQEGFSPKEYADRMAGNINVGWSPGYFFSYANGGHTLAAVAIENACACSYDSFMKEAIFAPLDMVDSTFLLADVDQDRLASSYHADGQTPAKRWRMPIRPSGAMLTTIRDLGKLVQFYATRGQSRPGLVSPTLLKRMEDSATTATSRVGLIDGTYGLGNFGSVTADGHILHGHAGSTEGFETWLTYDPETRRGYAFILNGSAGLRGRLINELSAHLTRDYTPVTPLPAISDASLADLDGWYEPINHHMELRRWMWRMFGAVKLTPSDSRLEVDPIVPTNQARSLVAVGGGKLRTLDLPIPTAARVEGPGGIPMLVNGEAFAPVSAVVAIGRFYGFTGAVLVGAIASLHMLFWLPRRLFASAPTGGALRLRFGLMVGGLSLVLLLAIFVQRGMLGPLDSTAAFGRIGFWSLLLMLLSLMGPLGTLLAASSWTGAQSKVMRVYSSLAIVLLGFAWVYLAVQGWVPLITWRV